MEHQFSLLIDTSSDTEDENLLKHIYELLMPSDVSKNSATKRFLLEYATFKMFGDKKTYYRYVPNFINDKKSIEIFLKYEPNSTDIFNIKKALESIKEIKSYRLMTIQTKVKIEINPV